MDATTFDPQLAKAFDFASELAKQLITLGTGVLALSVTFTKDILKGLPARGFSIITAAWASLLISVIAGVWFLAAMTGTLAHIDSGKRPSPYSLNVQIPSGIQEITFVVGIFLLALHGWMNLHPAAEKTNYSAE